MRTKIYLEDSQNHWPVHPLSALPVFLIHKLPKPSVMFNKENKQYRIFPGAHPRTLIKDHMAKIQHAFTYGKKYIILDL